MKTWRLFILCLGTSIAAIGSASAESVTPNELFFTATLSGPNPETQSFTIDNPFDETASWRVADANGLPIELPEWLSLNPASGMLDPNETAGSTQEVSVAIDKTGLAAGYYTFWLEIRIEGTEAYNESLQIRLSIGNPVLSVSTSTFSFSATVGNNPGSQTFLIHNDGTGTLNWTLDLSDKPNWLSVSPSSGSLSAHQGQTVTASVNVAGLSEGEYFYSFPATAPGAAGSPVVISVTLNILLGNPVLFVSKSNLNFSATAGINPVNQAFSVRNDGTGTMNWTLDLSDKPAWLSVGPVSGLLTANQSRTVTVSVNADGLTVGEYSYSFAVIAPGAAGSPVLISVTLDVFATYDWSTNPGTGTPEDPYQVSTLEQMVCIGYDPVLLTKCFILTNDIVFDPNNSPDHIFTKPLIGSFSGTFDGQGYVIRNLTIQSNSYWYIGLFAGINLNGKVLNLGIQNCSLKGAAIVDDGCCGSIAAGNAGTISNCYGIGRMAGNYAVGGLVGGNSGQISNSYADVTIQSITLLRKAGGLVGINNGTIVDSHSDGSVTGGEGGWYLGGLAGLNYYVISDSYATGAVAAGTNARYLGGFVGFDTTDRPSRIPLITNCFASGDVTGGNSSRKLGGFTGAYESYYLKSFCISDCAAFGTVTGGSNCRLLGGFIGDHTATTIARCYAKGRVQGGEGSQCIGGFTGGTDPSVAYVSITTVINECYASGPVLIGTMGRYVGGFIGYNTRSTSDSYASGSVASIGDDAAVIGGLAGWNSGTIACCFSVGQVDGGVGGEYAAGLCGMQYGTPAQISNSFWDIDGTGQSVGYYQDPLYPGTIVNVVGETTAEMMAEATFTVAGWDFTDSDGDAAVWMMLREAEDYPRLAWQPVSAGDIAGLYGVDMVDLMELANNWLEADCPTNCEQADIDHDGTVNMADLNILAEDWLE